MPASKKATDLHYCWESFLSALCVVVYVVLVVLLLRYSNGMFFAPGEPMFGMVAFLLLFVLSAAIVGILVLGKPILLYVEGQKKEGIRMLLCTIGWLVVALLVLLAVLYILYVSGVTIMHQ